MAALLSRLLDIVKVAVISGGAWAQFEKQVLAFLPQDDRLKNLSMLPTCGTKFYRFEGGWKKLHSEVFSADDKKKIIGAIDQAVDRSGHNPVSVQLAFVASRGFRQLMSALLIAGLSPSARGPAEASAIAGASGRERKDYSHRRRIRPSYCHAGALGHALAGTLVALCRARGAKHPATGKRLDAWTVGLSCLLT